jgi:hypothetical protein
MCISRVVGIISGVTLLLGLGAQAAKADTVDKRTYFTFNRPISVPGVTLPAGRYLFRIANPNTGGDVVQVLSDDGKTPYAMLFSIPDERPDATTGPEVRFLETGPNTPSAIKAWWYPGRTMGWEFIYSKREARMLAKGSRTPVLTTRADTTKLERAQARELSRLDAAGKEAAVTSTAKPAPMPATGDVVVGDLAPSELVIADAQTPPSASNTPARRTQLPTTASDLPLFGLIGLLAMAGAGGLRLLRTARA